MTASCEITKFTAIYVWGNEHAKRFYETTRFVEIDVVEEEAYKEVNLRYEICGRRALSLLPDTEIGFKSYSSTGGTGE